MSTKTNQDNKSGNFAKTNQDNNKKTENIEHYLDTNGELTYRNVGISMLPLIKQGRDIFTVTKKTAERCKKYDVILYKRHKADGQVAYVLHRVVGVRENDYVVLGDNCLNKEYGIKDSDILGIMTSYVRKGRQHDANDIGSKIYARIWYFIYPVRKVVLTVLNKIRRIMK